MGRKSSTPDFEMVPGTSRPALAGAWNGYEAGLEAFRGERAGPFSAPADARPGVTRAVPLSAPATARRR